MRAIQATVTKFMSLADGTLRLQLDVHQKDSANALRALCDVGQQVAVVALASSDAKLEAARADLGAGDLGDGVSIEPADEVAADLVREAVADECDPLAGKLMQHFYRGGLFHARPLLEALGKDAQFLQWVRSRDTCMHCDAPPTEDNPIQAAHYRKVGQGAGTGIKPEYSAVALCANCHREQHAQGGSVLGPEHVWEGWVTNCRHGWGHQRLREIFETESMTAIRAEWVIEWMDEHNCGHLVPGDFR